MEIIRLFPINIFMSLTGFPYLEILLIYERNLFRIFGQFRGFFKETNSKNWGFCIDKKVKKKKHEWLGY